MHWESSSVRRNDSSIGTVVWGIRGAEIENVSSSTVYVMICGGLGALMPCHWDA
jgi:hypothetical protein